MDIKTDIRNLKGIGEKTAGLYHRVGIYTYGDLVYYYPRDYMQYDEPVAPAESLIGSFIFTRVRLNDRPLMRKAGRMAVVTSNAVTDTGIMRVVWFHMPYLTKSLSAGHEYVFAGTLKRQGNTWSMEQPLIFTPEEYKKLENSLQPVYPLTKGLSNNAVKKAVKDAVVEEHLGRQEFTAGVDLALQVFHICLFVR